MSEENVEIVRKVLDAGNRLDTEAMLPYTDPEFELRSAIIGAAEGNIYRGHQGLRDWVAEAQTVFVDLRIEPEEFRDLGDEVLVIGRFHARGRESGVEIDSPTAWIFTFRDGRVVLTRGYLNIREALEAAGLQEEAWRASLGASSAWNLHEQGRQRQIVENGERLVGAVAWASAE